MPVLKDTNVQLGSAKLKAYCQSLKKPVHMLQGRIENFDTNYLSAHLASSDMHDIIKTMAAVNKLVLDMSKYLDVVIDNADVYYYDHTFGMARRVPTSLYVAYAYKDIGNIEEAAIKCIDVIDDHIMPK